MNIKKILIALAIIVAIAVPSFYFLQTKANDNSIKLSQNQENMALIYGTITSANPLMVETDASSYSINTSNVRMTDWFGADIGMDNIKVGDKVWVKGAMNGNNIMADSIVNQSMPEGATEVSGRISSMNGNNMMIENNDGSLRVMIDDNTVFIKDNKKVTSDDFAVGTDVQVVGIMDNDNNYLTAKYIATMSNVNATTTVPVQQ